MKNNVMTVMKKEFIRFFTDRRMVLTTLIMPGLMIYLMYSFMGNAFSEKASNPKDYKTVVYAENLPQSAAQAAEQGVPLEFKEIDSSEEQKILDKIAEAEDGYELLAVFPEDFEKKAQAYEVAGGEAAPSAALYYNSTSSNSNEAYRNMQMILDNFEASMANKFDVNPEDGTVYDMATEEDVAAQVFSMMIPMLMMIFLFSGCMAVAPESIAGEKERGTIATLLVTPVKRSHLALGKILSLSVIAILSGCSSFLGTMLSLPKMMGSMEEVKADVYGVSDYLVLLLIILSTVLVIISLISVVSAFAKSIKEANGWITPIMLISMLVGITSMIDSLCKTAPGWFLIPLYNSVQSMNSVFSMNIDMTNIIVTVLSNFVYAAVGVVALTKMFSSEKVMFSK